MTIQIRLLKPSPLRLNLTPAVQPIVLRLAKIGTVIQEVGGDLHYEVPFTVADDIIVIHNLGKKPAVTVIDSANDEVEGEITHTSNNQFRAKFSAPFSGVIICN